MQTQTVEDFGKQRILVVDDDPEMLGSIKAELQKKGKSVSTARTSSRALDMIVKDPDYDLILLDFPLDESDSGGASLVTRINEFYTSGNHYRPPRLAFMTDLEIQDFVISAFQSTGVLLRKPFDFGKDLRKLVQLLTPHIKQSHVRVIPWYDLQKGFLFLMQEDESGMLRERRKLIGGVLERYDHSLFERMRNESQEELSNIMEHIKPFGVVVEDEAVGHFFTGSLRIVPKQGYIPDPEAAGFVRDRGKVTKVLLYLSEEEISELVGDGFIRRGNQEGINDYKQLDISNRENGRKYYFTASARTRGYLLRKTGIKIGKKVKVYFWQYHQREHSQSAYDSETSGQTMAGRVLIASSHFWHALDRITIPTDIDGQKEWVHENTGGRYDSYLERILRNEALDKYLLKPA